MSLVTFLKFHLHFNYTDLEIIQNLCLTLHFRSNYRLQLLLISQFYSYFPWASHHDLLQFTFFCNIILR